MKKRVVILDSSHLVGEFLRDLEMNGYTRTVIDEGSLSIERLDGIVDYPWSVEYSVDKGHIKLIEVPEVTLPQELFDI